MTQLSLKIVHCKKCGTENKIIYYASINTLMDVDGSLISRLLDGTLNTSKCKHCGIKIRLSSDVLVNSPNGMFYLNPTDDLEYKKKQFKTYGMITEKGVLLYGLASLFFKQSQFSKAKKRLLQKKNYTPSPKPPPAPKITSHTKYYNEISEKLSKKLLKNKKDEKSTINTKKQEPPPPPPPPPPES
ncbi:MAG: CpXC domain-containing protein [Promethearchaeota archaeon]